MIKIQHILFPIDFSKHAIKAFDYAIAFTLALNAHTLYLLFVNDVASQGTFLGEKGDLAWREAEKQIEKKAQWQLENFVPLIPIEKQSSLNIEKIVKRGLTHREILKTAKDFDIDLIIMATQGERSESPLGSVTEKVARNAPCPVLTIRNP